MEYIGDLHLHGLYKAIPGALVHHINSNEFDNRNENLLTIKVTEED